MPRSKRGPVACSLIVAALGLASMPATAGACSCATTGSERGDARAILERSDAAFIGVLKSVTPEDGEEPFEAAVFRYRVKRDFGRDLGRFVRLRASTSSAACGLQGREDRRYALGISREQGVWSSNLCAYMRPRTLRAVAGESLARARRAAACGVS